MKMITEIDMRSTSKQKKTTTAKLVNNDISQISKISNSHT